MRRKYYEKVLKISHNISAGSVYKNEDAVKSILTIERRSADRFT